jgi:hypothetical protein
MKTLEIFAKCLKIERRLRDERKAQKVVVGFTNISIENMTI